MATDTQEPASRPATRSIAVVATLNDRWRIADDPLQWILEKRRSGDEWRGRSFCRTKAALLRCICEHVEGDIDLVEFIKVSALPDWHSDWEDAR